MRFGEKKEKSKAIKYYEIKFYKLICYKVENKNFRMINNTSGLVTLENDYPHAGCNSNY